MRALKIPHPPRRQAGCVPLFENLNVFYGAERYPDPDPVHLRELMGDQFAKLHGLTKPFPAESILLTNGAVDALDLVFKGLSEPGDQVMLLEPAFMAFEQYARLHRLDVVRERLRGADQNQLPVDEIVRSGAKFVLLNTPNNPLGTTLSLQEISELLVRFAGFVVIDEAYIEYAPDQSVLRLCESHPNLLILRTFSKAWAMPGARCGWLAGGPDFVQMVRDVQTPFAVSADAQTRLQQRLLSFESLRLSWKELQREKTWLYQNLIGLEFFDRVYPSESSFIAVSCQNSNRVYERLLESGVQVANAGHYQADLLRISVGRHWENQALIQALKERPRF